MESLIQVFRMNELRVRTRIKIMKKLGAAINHQFCANCTEELVIELCLALDPECGIEKEEHYKHYYKAI